MKGSSPPPATRLPLPLSVLLPKQTPRAGANTYTTRARSASPSLSLGSRGWAKIKRAAAAPSLLLALSRVRGRRATLLARHPFPCPTDYCASGPDLRPEHGVWGRGAAGGGWGAAGERARGRTNSKGKATARARHQASQADLARACTSVAPHSPQIGSIWRGEQGKKGHGTCGGLVREAGTGGRGGERERRRAPRAAALSLSRPPPLPTTPGRPPPMLRRPPTRRPQLCSASSLPSSPPPPPQRANETRERRAPALLAPPLHPLHPPHAASRPPSPSSLPQPSQPPPRTSARAHIRKQTARR
jgi:hypothetical protein